MTTIYYISLHTCHLEELILYSKRPLLRLVVWCSGLKLRPLYDPGFKFSYMQQFLLPIQCLFGVHWLFHDGEWGDFVRLTCSKHTCHNVKVNFLKKMLPLEPNFTPFLIQIKPYQRQFSDWARESRENEHLPFFHTISVNCRYL